MRTAESTLRKEILTETYADMRNLIFDIAWKFQRIHGGDIDDLIGEANLLFIKTIDSYDETESSLTTWLYICINNGLKTHMRKEYEQTHISIDNEKVNLNPQNSNSFSVMELLDEMEKDALTILQLFLETPKDIIINVLEEGKQMNHIQGYMRKRLRNRMRQLGWTISRITKAFEEIKTAIQ